MTILRVEMEYIYFLSLDTYFILIVHLKWAKFGTTYLVLGEVIDILEL